MKYLLTQDIDGADWGRVVADEKGVFVKGFDFDFSSYKLVDLGLSVKWADRNIGAASPEDSGLYFQWGDTKGYTAEQCGTVEGQKPFTWADYKYATTNEKGSLTGLLKYTDEDGQLTIVDTDDAAHAADSKLRMPTRAEMEELFELEKEWVIASRDTTSDPWGEGVPYANVKDADVRKGEMNFHEKYCNFIEETSTKKFLGINFIGKNGNKLFVPAAGLCCDTDAQYRGDKCRLWTSSLDDINARYAVIGGFRADGAVSVDIDDRFFGCSVRGVAATAQ